VFQKEEENPKRKGVPLSSGEGRRKCKKLSTDVAKVFFAKQTSGKDKEEGLPTEGLVLLPFTAEPSPFLSSSSLLFFSPSLF